MFASCAVAAALPSKLGEGVGAARGEHQEHSKGVVPFVVLQGITLELVFLFPQIALWLPKAIGW